MEEVKELEVMDGESPSGITFSIDRFGLAAARRGECFAL
jgi:hypothetical protein